MLDWIKNINIFGKDNIFSIDSDVEQSPIEDSLAYIWCLVGNIVAEHPHGAHRELKRGTRHFSPNTKVYCFSATWGDGYEKIKVIGKHRKSGRNVCLVMSAKLITNWRLQKVYQPRILNLMKIHYGGWTNSEEDKETILTMLTWLPERTIKPLNE